MKKEAKKFFPRRFQGVLRLLLFSMTAWMFSWCVAGASAAKDVFKTTVVIGDFYAWAYTQAFQDKAHSYAWTTAGVDAFGWGLIVAGSREGLFLVNLANTVKLLYPIVRLAGSAPPEIEHRAWVSLGTHAATLLTLHWLGKVEVGVRFSRQEERIFLATRF